MVQIEEKLQSVLPRVSRPGRYWGHEIHAVSKDPEKTDVHIALAFPDMYEIGMSHVGFEILYHILNAVPWVWAQRTYAVWPDMEREMLDASIPLFTLESKRPVNQADIVAFTLQYELQYTTVLAMLSLAGIPVRAADRKEGDPLVIAGGPCACNPEPMSMFFDAFALGDGEEMAVDIACAVREARRCGTGRRGVLERLAEIEGLYVPAVRSREQLLAQGKTVRARKTEGLKEEYYPENPLVPLIEVTHDRHSLEVMRGCTRGCRFCGAGMIYRPVRERDPAGAAAKAGTVLSSTGFEEISMVSLSTSDYSGLRRLLPDLATGLSRHPVSVAFPSLRPETFTDEMAEAAGGVRKSGLTLAPEAGTQRLRDVINKNNTEEDLFRAAETGFRHGFRKVKLYFMTGLPTETEEDIRGIAELARGIADLGKKHGGVAVHVSLSPFSPKPHTPFQWEAQDTPEVIREKTALLRKLTGKKIKVSWRDPRVSQLETVLGRGDAELGRVIEAAWAGGARLDAWTEHFNVNHGRWTAAFEKASIDPGRYTAAIDTRASLPWDHISYGLSRSWLLTERERAYRGEVTPDCRTAGCSGCGLSDHPACREGSPAVEAAEQPKGGKTPDRSGAEQSPEVAGRLRIRYSKGNEVRFTSHLDTVRLFVRALRRGNLPVAFSRGFHTHARFTPGPPLPLGYTSSAEYADIDFSAPVPAGCGSILNTYLPAGLEITDTRVIGKKPRSLSSVIDTAVYLAQLDSGADLSAADENIRSFLRANTVRVERTRKGRVREVDIRAYVKGITREENTVRLVLSTGPSGSARVEEVLSKILEHTGLGVAGVGVMRQAQLCTVKGEQCTPMDIV